MTFNHLIYVPCLLWKTGEYQAVWHLPEAMKDKIMPLVEVPAFSFDFEERKKPKTINQHVDNFQKRLFSKWEKRPCFVDMQYLPYDKNMPGGENPISFIFDKLIKADSSAIPVTGPSRNIAYQNEIKKILSNYKGLDICFRISLEDLSRDKFQETLDSLFRELKVKLNQVHLVIDLGTPNFEPINGFVIALQATLNKITNLNDWLSFSIIGTSFPQLFGKGILELPRFEWLLYKALVDVFKKSGIRIPSFGDYAVTRPGATPDLDWRVVKTAAKLKYTIDDGWYIVKGDSLRDGSPTQCHDMCRALTQSSRYAGSTFSYGDQFIQRCADDNSIKTRQATIWVTIGTNQHLTKVIYDLANFYVSSGNP